MLVYLKDASIDRLVEEILTGDVERDRIGLVVDQDTYFVTLQCISHLLVMVFKFRHFIVVDDKYVRFNAILLLDNVTLPLHAVLVNLRSTEN